jgi:hypothetical protein
MQRQPSQSTDDVLIARVVAVGLGVGTAGLAVGLLITASPAGAVAWALTGAAFVGGAVLGLVWARRPVQGSDPAVKMRPAVAAGAAGVASIILRSPVVISAPLFALTAGFLAIAGLFAPPVPDQ